MTSLTDNNFDTGGSTARPLSNNSSWYALRIQSKLSALVIPALRRKGYETFLPSYTSRRRWSDRIKVTEAPLFPGYLFCRFHLQHRLSVLSTPGVIGVIGFAKVPAPIEDDEIEAIRTVVLSGLTPETWPFPGVGATVTIDSGPLKGLEGILVNADRIDRLVVSVTLLQRSVAVEIDREWIRPSRETSGVSQSSNTAGTWAATGPRFSSR